jgi:hypothetical protein
MIDRERAASTGGIGTLASTVAMSALWELGHGMRGVFNLTPASFA